MLDVTVLVRELQRFGDLSAALFESWPTYRRRARENWASAFTVYVRGLADVTPVLTPHAVTLDFDTVEETFFSTITLDRGSRDSAGEDFATAWRAAVNAITPGASASDASSTPFTFERFDPFMVATRGGDLSLRLAHLFRGSSTTRLAALTDIATAIHDATNGILSTATPYVVTYG